MMNYDKVKTALLIKLAGLSKEASLKSLAKPYYPAEGSHGWNHIKDVLARARAMIRHKHQKWTPQMQAAAVFHDSGLYPNGITLPQVRQSHQLRGAQVAAKALKNQFSKQQLKRIAAAIREHRGSYKGQYTSKLSDLISSADRGKPDMNAKIHRAFKYHTQLGQDPQTAYNNVAEHLAKKYGTQGYARLPQYYQSMYAKQLADYKQKMQNLTPQYVKKVIQES